MAVVTTEIDEILGDIDENDHSEDELVTLFGKHVSIDFMASTVIISPDGDKTEEFNILDDEDLLVGKLKTPYEDSMDTLETG